MTDSARPSNAPKPAVPRRAVVTGAAGFIGSHLASALLQSGAMVIGVDRRDPDTDPTAAANLAELEEEPGFVRITADLRTCAIDPVLLDADVIFHLAGIPGVRPSWGPGFDDYVASNVLATQRVMTSATRLRIPRVVVASSSSVYGPTSGAPSRETDPPCPASPYAVTKLAEEQLCLAHAARPDSVTSVVALRYFTVYGPRQREDMLIHRVLSAALAGRPVKVYGDGRQLRDFTYVGDAVAATIAAATAPVGTRVVNVGAGGSTSLTEILALVERLTGTPVPTQRAESRNGDVPATLADRSKAQRILAWEPRVDLAAGVEAQLRCLAAGLAMSHAAAAV